MDWTPQRPLVVGWKEYIDFPDWGVRRVKVKVDTGARTSAVGATSYELRQVDGRLLARLTLALRRRRPDRLLTVEVPVLRMVVVANSSGMREQRPLIEARIRLGPVTKRIALTVTNRAAMLFPVILGRQALQGDFIVDVGRKYLLREHA
jgi:hypothetical protein